MKSLLIVDDDAVTTEFLQIFCSDIGFNIKVASSVAEAATAIKEGDFAFVLSDFSLDDGTACDIANLMDREQLSAQLIITTGFDKQELVRKGLKLERVLGVLEKPVDLKALQTLIQD